MFKGLNMKNNTAVDRNAACMYTAFLLFAITKGQLKFACEMQLLWRQTLNIPINYAANVLRLTYSVNCPCRSTCRKFGIATGMSHIGDLKHIAMESVYGMTKWCNSWFLNYANLGLQMEVFKKKQTTSFSQNSNKSPTRCNSFPVYYPYVYLQLNMFQAGPTTNTARLSPRYEGKTRGCHCSHWAPDDGRENTRNMLSCK